MNFIWNSYNLCTAMLNFAQNKASLTTVSEDLTKTFYSFRLEMVDMVFFDTKSFTETEFWIYTHVSFFHF